MANVTTTTAPNAPGTAAPNTSLLYIAPAGRRKPGETLVSADTVAPWPDPQPKREASAQLTVKISGRITFAGEAGKPGSFHVVAYVLGSVHDDTTNGYASVTCGSARAATSLSQPAFQGTIAPVQEFSYGQAQSIDLEIVANAFADIGPNNPGRIIGHAEVSLVPEGTPALEYLWDTVDITIAISSSPASAHA